MHPIYKVVDFAWWTQRRGGKDNYPPPMQTLFDALGLKPKYMEKISIVRRDPYWVHAMEIQIAPSKHEALADEMADTAPIHIYSDGSGLEGRIGTATVMFKRGTDTWDPEEEMSLRKYLGEETEQMVYAAEQAGEVTNTSIYIDSQAALKALRSNKPVSGHQIADEIHKAYTRVMEKHPAARITFR